MSTRENLEKEAAAAGEKFHEASETIKTGAQDVLDEAKTTANLYAEQGMDVAVSSLGDFASAVRRASDELNERDQGLAARLVSQAADGLEQAASSISGATLDDMMGSVQRFARQNPAAFVGVAVLAGIALGRFAKASSERDHTDYDAPSRDGFASSGGYGRSTGYGSSGPSRSTGAYSGTQRPTGTYSGTQRPTGASSGTQSGMAGTASAGRPMTAGTGPSSRTGGMPSGPVGPSNSSRK